MRKKCMTEEEFITVLSNEWKPINLKNGERPKWMKNIPKEKICAVFASGSYEQKNPENDGNSTEQNQIGGIDVYRYAEEKDGVILNKDWYRVIQNPDDTALLLVLGPFQDKEHWINNIPDRLKHAKVLKKEN